MHPTETMFIFIKAVGVAFGYKLACRLFRNGKPDNENKKALICGITAFFVMLIFS